MIYPLGGGSLIIFYLIMLRVITYFQSYYLMRLTRKIPLGKCEEFVYVLTFEFPTRVGLYQGSTLNTIFFI